MHILISGSHGFVGSALVPLLRGRGHRVSRLVRSRPQSSGEVGWNPERGELDAELAGACDAIIHLSGEPVAGRWTPAKKEAILRSRVDSTRLLAEAVARSGGRQVLVCASAIGIYGERGEQVLGEDATPGAGFLADVCQQWEAAAEPARAAGARVAHARIGVVLSPRGGALGALLPIFKLGLGGKLGNGQQWMSWISLPDVANALVFAVENEAVSGPANLVAPAPIRNQVLVQSLGRVLRRPTVAAVPAFALRAALGEAADEMLLFSTRVAPQVLLRAGFRFEHPALDEALATLL
jgi:uncharacterized protein (TIGR01777 family)